MPRLIFHLSMSGRGVLKNFLCGSYTHRIVDRTSDQQRNEKIRILYQFPFQKCCKEMLVLIPLPAICGKISISGILDKPKV